MSLCKFQYVVHRLLMLMALVLSVLTANGQEVISFTGHSGGAVNVYDKVNSPAVYFTSPASKNGATKLLLKSVQLYTFLDGTGSASNLQDKTVYLGVSTTKPTNITVGGTGAPHTAASGISLKGFSNGVTYNSEGYTIFEFPGDGLEIDPVTEYVFYLTRSTAATTGFTYYNFRFRVWANDANTGTYYYGQAGNLLKWMPFYIVTLSDKEESVSTTIPNPAMTEEEIRQDMEASEGGTEGTSTATRYLKCFGFTTPVIPGISSFTTSAVNVYMPYYDRTKNNNYRLVIAKSNIASGTIAANEIIAVSTNTIRINNNGAGGNKTFNFDTFMLRSNTTYYAYFTTANNAATNGFTPSYCPMQVKTSSVYQPTTFSSDTYNGTYLPRTNYWPVFSMNLTKGMEPYAEGDLQTLWSSYNNAHPWRIPSLAKTRRGNMVALGGWLICNMDIGNGECHIASKTSADGGLTWSAVGAAVATGSGTAGADDCGYGDAAIVADRESDRILVMCASGNVGYPNSTRSKPIRVARIYGTDSPSGNITWGSPSDVTASVYGVNTSMQGLFFASGRILQSRAVKVGDYYRLYSALLYHTGSGVHHNIVVYSDDFGETWHQLGTTDAIASGANEAKVEEMPNGDIFISSRKASGRYFNLFKFTDLKAATGSWGTTQTLSLGSGDSCNGEILFVNVKKADGTNCILALQSMPSVTENATISNYRYYPRQKVRIYWREVSQNDLGTIGNWTSGWSATNSYMVSCSGSAYSTMVVTPDNKIGFMLENNYYDHSSMPRSDLQYVKLSLSTITGGAYTELVNEFELGYRTDYATTVAVNNSDMRFDQVNITREDMTDSERYYTLCLPYDMTSDEFETAGITSVETLGEYTGTGFQFVSLAEGEGITALQPYIVQGGAEGGLALTAQNGLILKNPAVGEVESNGATFMGNLVEEYNLSEGGTVNAYGYATSGNFAKASATAKIHAYCAYVVAPGDQTAKSLTVSFDEPVPTGIDDVTIEMPKGVIYNLAGQRVSDSYKGIVIMNGKKYLKK